MKTVPDMDNIPEPPKKINEYKITFISKGRELICPIMAFSINDAIVEFGQTEFIVDKVICIE